MKFNGNKLQRKYDADFNGNVLGDARHNDMYKTIVATTSHSLQSFPDKSLPHLFAKNHKSKYQTMLAEASLLFQCMYMDGHRSRIDRIVFQVMALGFSEDS